MKRLLHIALLVLGATMLLANCDDEEQIADSLTHYRYDIVTYMGSDAAGNARFELVGRDDSASVMLTARYTMASTVQPWQRVLLRYDWADARNGGAERAVEVYGCTSILSDSLRYTAQPLEHYLVDIEPLKMRSIWRTGEFINLHCQLPYTGKSRHFYLLLDSTTWRHDTVHCHLVHRIYTDTTYHWRDAYASFNVGNIWKLPSCRTLRLHITEDRNAHAIYDFNK